MSDPFGGVASGITLLQFAQTIIKLRKAVKDAPEDWQRYKDKLLGLAYVSISPADVRLYQVIDSL